MKYLLKKNEESLHLDPYYKLDYLDVGYSIHLRAENNQIDLLCNGTKVTYKDLCSGERLIVSMLARKNINFKAEFVLLDEPDKHLDPKLCKLFMKVIRDVFLKIGI